MGLPFLESRSTFRNCIIHPQEDKKELRNLEKLLGSICLRRSREVIALPEPTIKDRRLDLSSIERQRYLEIDDICTGSINDAEERKHESATRQATLRRYLRLRMTCNNGTYERNPPSLHEDPFAISTADNSMSCPTCFIDSSVLALDNTSGVSLCERCVAHLCDQCKAQHVGNIGMSAIGSRRSCSTCQKTYVPHIVSAGDSHFDELTDEELDHGMSTKLSAIIKDIEEHRHLKGVVFSSWKTTLDLLLRILRRRGIVGYFIHGEKSFAERRKILDAFRGETGSVLLMTLGTGAVGLNLSTASRIHIVEPQWNPAVESQVSFIFPQIISKA